MLLVSAPLRSGESLKYKRHLFIGAYLALGIYSLKQLLEATENTFYVGMLQKDIFDYPSLALNYKKSQLLFMQLCNLIKCSVFGLATYFSVKNILQELKDEENEKSQEICSIKNKAEDKEKA